MTQPIEIQFKKAVKFDARGRVALVGPPGSGKSKTSLILARLLAGPKGKIAATDTEHGTLSKYADEEDFDVFDLESYSPENFVAALDEAERQKYDVFICDSLSHFWMGKDGALEFVDERKKIATAKGRDQMDGWKDFRPHEREMVDRMLASPCHIIVTMRTKNEYINEEYTTSRGERKTRRTKIGLAPVQREGLEYEFDLCGLMTTDNELIIDKTRCSHYARKTVVRPSAKDFQPFAEWLKGAPPVIKTAAADWRAPAEEAFGRIEARIGQAQFATLLKKTGYESLADLPDRDKAVRVYASLETAAAFYPDVVKEPPQDDKPVRKDPTPVKPSVPEPVQEIWKTMTNPAAVSAAFSALKKQLGDLTNARQADDIYSSCLARGGVENPSHFKSVARARHCLLDLWEHVDMLGNPTAEEMRGAA